MRSFFVFAYLGSALAQNYFPIIPLQLSCPLCISIINSFKEQVNVNPNFKQELRASCELLSKSDKNQMAICRSEFTEAKMNILKTKTPKEICKLQKLCKKGDATEISSEDHRGVPDFATIAQVRGSIDEPVPGEDVVKKLLDVLGGKNKEFRGRDLRIHFNLKFLPPIRYDDATTTESVGDNAATSTVKPDDC
ncbi:unnamed protein product [Toxocara canis]|uniref:Saposin B-type domain-containing protein n=1 Tax=Toxocara canis TaxID=6265 RepID=A0A183UQ43_TOXCA|nr:unnamed protein product [Toxocara canis]